MNKSNILYIENNPINNNTKKKVYSKVNELLVNNVRINSFEKKPIKGGTPAIENKINVMRVK